jgi:hypothetical protein
MPTRVVAGQRRGDMWYDDLWGIPPWPTTTRFRQRIDQERWTLKGPQKLNVRPGTWSLLISHLASRRRHNIHKINIYSHVQIWTAASARSQICPTLSNINIISTIFPFFSTPSLPLHTHTKCPTQSNLPASSPSQASPLLSTPCRTPPAYTMSTYTSTCMHSGQLRVKQRFAPCRVCAAQQTWRVLVFFSSKKPSRKLLLPKIHKPHINPPVLYVFLEPLIGSPLTTYL